jgi:UvrD-like helicase C-terminal domain
MPLINQFVDEETKKELMQKKLLFPIELVLGDLKTGKIDLKKANKRICDIIEFDGIVATTDIVEKVEVEFVSDDEPVSYFSEGEDISFYSGDANKADDPISSMFDFYLKPNYDNSNLGFGSSTSFSQQNVAKPLPIVDWHKVSKLNDCVILYRTHSQSRSIEEVFLKNKVPYRLVSGTRFLDRKEIRDVMSILKFMANGSDKIALSRFLPLVLDGVGPKTLERILAYLEDYEYPLVPKYQELVLKLFTRMQNCWSTCKTLIDLCKELLIVTGYHVYLKKEFPNKEEFNERMENIGEIYSLMLAHDEDTDSTLSEKLTNFLAQVSLMSMVDNTTNDPDQPKINLMSLHQSKGLEYETVFLVGCEDGLLPHQNSFLDSNEMEEEVRLAYVGVTRAKQNLFLLSAESRITFGQIKANPASRIFRPFLSKNCKQARV